MTNVDIFNGMRAHLANHEWAAYTYTVGAIYMGTSKATLFVLDSALLLAVDKSVDILQLKDIKAQLEKRLNETNDAPADAVGQKFFDWFFNGLINKVAN